MIRNLTIFVVAITFLAGFARADATTDFAAKLDLSTLRTIAVQQNQTVKTIDSYSRELLESISGRSSIDGLDPVFTVFDIAYHPGDYANTNLIKIKNLPMRTDFRQLTSISSDEQERIVKTGLISMALFEQSDVQALLAKVESTDVRKAQAVQQVQMAYQTLKSLSTTERTDLLLPAATVPPAIGSADGIWHRLIETLGSDQQWAKAILAADKIPAALPNYRAADLTPCFAAMQDFERAWDARDADAVNTVSVTLANALGKINPVVYPSPIMRQVEVTYNRLAKMTLPGAAFYFFAFVCFLMAANSGVTGLRLWGLRLFIIGYLIHTAGIGIRWWLVGSIPIKNEFESVMFSAWFGATLGLVLEFRFGRGFFGACASFVGWLSLVAIFTVPYVFHTSIGENIGQVNGVLMSYWLYIHVTMVTASYSMIGMAFLLGTWWLIKYYMDYGTLSRVSGRALEGDVAGFDPVVRGGGGGAAVLSPTATLARLLFFPVAEKATPIQKIKADEKSIAISKSTFLASLDACNLVVLQLAFWTLGTGIILGAVWADESWGRPWAWDPKETFALVTWIAYLVIVHVRVATQHKAWWTAVLSIGGFFLMLFNWIGVNYFLPGLHSYAG